MPDSTFETFLHSFPLPDFSAISFFPLVYALVLGGLIGFEREMSGRAAGLRTHVIVCVSSTMLIMISQYVGTDSELASSGRLVFDPNRMSAGIVTGIGFLGAATVLRSGDMLRGLTTAACIWFVAGLGIVLGNQRFELAIVSTLIVLLVLTLLNRLTGLIHPLIYRRLIVLHRRQDVEKLTEAIMLILGAEGCRVLDIASGHNSISETHELVFYVSLKNGLQSPRVTEQVASVEGIESARWKLISNPH